MRFLRGMATFGSLIFHFISIRVKRLWRKKDNSQSGANLYFFHSMTCSYFSSFPQPASSDFSVIFHFISFKLGWLIEIVTCLFDDYILGWVGQRSKSQREEIEKKLRSQFLCHCLLNVSQSWQVHSHWVVNYYKTCSGL